MILNMLQRKPHLTLTAAAAFLLAVAYGFQFAGYLPCELCWWQRYPYMAIIPLGISFALAGQRYQRVGLLVLAAFLVSEVGIAIFHVGVEQLWWEGLDTCSGTLDIRGLSREELLAAMQSDIPRCDEATWSLLGISMAGWNGIAALILLGYALRAFFRGRHRTVIGASYTGNN